MHIRRTNANRSDYKWELVPDEDLNHFQLQLNFKYKQTKELIVHSQLIDIITLVLFCFSLCREPSKSIISEEQHTQLLLPSLNKDCVQLKKHRPNSFNLFVHTKTKTKLRIMCEWRKENKKELCILCWSVRTVRLLKSLQPS